MGKPGKKHTKQLFYKKNLDLLLINIFYEQLTYNLYPHYNSAAKHINPRFGVFDLFPI